MLTGLVPGRGTAEVGFAKAISGAAAALSISVCENAPPPPPPPPVPGVVPVTGALCADPLPAASSAVTVYVWVLPGDRPLIVALVVDTVATTGPPSETSYEAAGSPLFDSDQDRPMLELVVPVTVRPVGVAGLWLPPCAYAATLVGVMYLLE